MSGRPASPPAPPAPPLVDYHVHSTFSEDGLSPPEECIAAAVSGGLSEIIFTEHLEFPPPSGWDEPAYVPLRILPAAEYRREIERLRARWGRRIRIGMGAELGLEGHNLASAGDFIRSHASDYDLVLGSLHAVDGLLVQAPEYVDRIGPAVAGRLYLEALARGVAAAAELGVCDVVGHLDLVKRGQSFGAFNPADHGEALEDLLRTIVESGLGLEVNTSGYRQPPGEPYPGLEVLRWYRRLGGRIVTIGSDSHSAQTVGWETGAALDLIREAGFSHLTLFYGRKPHPVPV